MTTKQPIPDEQKLALVNDAIEKLPLDLLQQVAEKRVGPMDWDAVLAEVERRGLDFYSWWTKFGLVEIMRFVRVDGGMMLRWFRSLGPQGGELPIDGNQPYPWTSKFQTCDTLTAAADCLRDWKRMLTAKTAANQSAAGKPKAKRKTQQGKTDFPKAFEAVQKLTTVSKITNIASGLRLLAEDAEFIDCEEVAPRTGEQSNHIFAAVQIAADEPDVEAWFRSHGTDALFRLAQFRETLAGLQFDWKQIADMEADVLAFADWLDMLAGPQEANSEDQAGYDRKQRGLEANNKGMTWPQVAELLGEPRKEWQRIRQEITRHATKTKQKIKKKPAGKPRKKN